MKEQHSVNRHNTSVECVKIGYNVCLLLQTHSHKIIDNLQIDVYRMPAIMCPRSFTWYLMRQHWCGCLLIRYMAYSNRQLFYSWWFYITTKPFSISLYFPLCICYYLLWLSPSVCIHKPFIVLRFHAQHMHTVCSIHPNTHTHTHTTESIRLVILNCANGVDIDYVLQLTIKSK